MGNTKRSTLGFPCITTGALKHMGNTKRSTLGFPCITTGALKLPHTQGPEGVPPVGVLYAALPYF